LEATDLAKPGRTNRFKSTDPDLASADAAGQDCGRFWNRTELCFRSKPGPPAGYPDPLLTLSISNFKYLNDVHKDCAESYAVGYMDQYGMTVVIETDLS
jgi:hypothetical protein